MLNLVNLYTLILALFSKVDLMVRRENSAELDCLATEELFVKNWSVN